MENYSDLAVLFGKYAPWLAFLPFLSRAYYALRNGGGIIGAWRGLWYGTNEPKVKK